MAKFKANQSQTLLGKINGERINTNLETILNESLGSIWSSNVDIELRKRGIGHKPYLN
jgi:hypothetical protein